MPTSQAGSSTILVVDDMIDNLVVISLVLQGKGYRVVTADTGPKAIEIARLARPDLILMDIHMPEMDGLAAARRIRDELANTPIVALTAFSTEGFQKAAYDIGFEGYLNKPINFDRLEAVLEKLIHRRRTA